MAKIVFHFVLGLLVVLTLNACSLFGSSTSYERINALIFAKVDGVDLKGDLFVPRNSSRNKIPVVIVVHGGGWTSRTGDMESICKKIARAGYAAFNITYRLAPQYHYPTQVNDVKSAIAWIKKNGDRYNLDSTNIAGWGYSAGAHLIMMAGLDPSQNLKAIVSGGTPAELTAWPHSPLVFKLIGHTMQDDLKAWKDASPVNNVYENSPPVFLYHGEWDTTVEVDQLERMEKALRAKGVHVETYRIPWMGHFAVYLFSAKSDTLGIQFLKKYLSE